MLTSSEGGSEGHETGSAPGTTGTCELRRMMSTQRASLSRMRESRSDCVVFELTNKLCECVGWEDEILHLETTFHTNLRQRLAIDQRFAHPFMDSPSPVFTVSQTSKSQVHQVCARCLLMNNKKKKFARGSSTWARWSAACVAGGIAQQKMTEHSISVAPVHSKFFFPSLWSFYL